MYTNSSPLWFAVYINGLVKNFFYFPNAMIALAVYDIFALNHHLNISEYRVIYDQQWMMIFGHNWGWFNNDISLFAKLIVTHKLSGQIHSIITS